MTSPRPRTLGLPRPRIAAGPARMPRVGLVAALAALATVALPAVARASATVEVLTGVSSGVVRVQYNTKVNIAVIFEPNAAGTADDTARVDALGPTDMTPGPGCALVSSTRIRCNGQVAPSVKLQVINAAGVQQFGTPSGNQDDTVRFQGMLPPAVPGPTIATGDGNDLVDLSQAVNTAGIVSAPFANSWTVNTGAGDDRIDGSARSENIIAGSGDDLIVPAPRLGNQVVAISGADTIRGGTGVDRLDFAARERRIFADLAGDRTITGAGQEGTVPDRDVEDVVGTEFDDTIVGTDSDNEILGLGGRDVIRGNGGDDRLAAFREVIPSPEPRGPLPPPAPPTPDDDADDLDGGPGADILNVSRDGIRDRANCGANGLSTGGGVIGGRLVTFTFEVGDTVYADLVDDPDNCEEVIQQDKNERGMVELSPRGKGIGRDRKLRVRLHCPQGALTDCNGYVGIGAGKREVAKRDRVRYSVKRGRKATAEVTLPEGTRIGKRTKVFLVAVEKGKANPRERSLLLNPQ